MMRFMLLSAVAMAAATAVSAASAFAQSTGPATQPAGDLPVKVVTLFSSGVGYFEHAGSVTGQKTVSLRFKTEQINDILKSLVLQDLDGGKISTVQYASEDPIEKTLGSFQIDIGQNPSLADLLNQLRGAKVSVKRINDAFTGVILGVEQKQLPQQGDKPPVVTPVLNLIDGATIRQLQLDLITDIKLEDAALQDELSRALMVLAGARDKDKKAVTLNFAGEGDRRVRVGYVVASPVWKTSYRLILDDKTPKLQGWAIVENQTDNDWTDVQLSLVSGRPISFMMNLYQPLYVNRPTVELELYQSLRPQVYGQGMATESMADVAAPASPAPMMRAKRAARPGSAFNDSIGSAGQSREELDFSSSVDSIASASKLGELFQYTIGNVSLPRQQSAMIPIVTDQVGVEKLSIYNQGVLAKHPLNGAMLTNTTDKHLLQGPLTVFEAGGYAGDAQIDNVSPGQKRLLSYGIDLQLLVQPTDSGNVVMQGGKIVKGVLQTERKIVNTTKYDVQSTASADKVLIIETPKLTDWKLTTSEKPLETTDRLYRFRLPIAKGEKKNFAVTQERIEQQQFALVSFDPGELVSLVREGGFSDEVKKSLSEVVRRQEAVSDAKRKLRASDNRVSAVRKEQASIRENMKAVDDKTSQYYTRLLAKLNDQETQIEELQKASDGHQAELDKASAELAKFLGELSVG